MFQYAVGRALSLARQQPLLLDVSDFASYNLHQGFELQRVFNCPVAVASAEDMQSILGWQSNKLIKPRLACPRWAALRRRSFVVEPHFQYWAGIQYVPASVYLMGYWQSERYFQDISDIIRADFSFKLPLNEKNAEIAENISQVNAVSLHIRRGDYIQNPVTHAVYESCGFDYYSSAIQFIANTIEQPYFFIFSDDIAWVKENFVIPFACQYITNNQNMESYNDMRLMSLCQHHIIANSSFSWWGAWLNSKPNKIMIAPKKWFADDKNTSDLLPESWIKL